MGEVLREPDTGIGSHATVAGLVLAGGRAQRMGGAEKALLPLDGAPLLAHVVRRLQPQTTGLVLSANGDPARFAAHGLLVVADRTQDAGPLAGLLAGTTEIAKRWPGATYLVSVPVDTPFIPPDLVQRLALAADDATVAVATSGGRTHHAVALWPVAVRTELLAAFDGGERSVRRFAMRLRTTVVDWPDVPLDPFFNINTPADLARAERHAGALSLCGL